MPRSDSSSSIWRRAEPSGFPVRIWVSLELESEPVNVLAWILSRAPSVYSVWLPPAKFGVDRGVNLLCDGTFVGVEPTLYRAQSLARETIDRRRYVR